MEIMAKEAFKEFVNKCKTGSTLNIELAQKDFEQIEKDYENYNYKQLTEFKKEYGVNNYFDFAILLMDKTLEDETHKDLDKEPIIEIFKQKGKVRISFDPQLERTLFYWKFPYSDEFWVANHLILDVPFHSETWDLSSIKFDFWAYLINFWMDINNEHKIEEKEETKMYFDNENITAEESDLLGEAIECILANGEDVLKSIIRQDNISLEATKNISSKVFENMERMYSLVCYLFEKIGNIDEEKKDEYEF